MLNRDDFYSFQITLNNLLLLKLAHDNGFDMNAFSSYVCRTVGDETEWGIFIECIDQLVEQWEYYSPHDYDNSNQTEKDYWLDLAGWESSYSSEGEGVLVMLDDRISPFTRFGFGGTYNANDWYQAYGEVYPIDKGMVLVFSEDDGAVDWVEPLMQIIEEFNKYKTKQEELVYEVAV